ncbi:hypothetical protein SKAU_G00419510 [Synaphobranchus kaupii]|uniref:G-protein coupled receptor family C group 6 member A n=1 Tax=Synaphobranchus kaupii TaxID=118154 RepID=A0A9Q1E6J4_SYNKA|nr:hypothetical protein SKAU_G00419510 [Synaphobranchus kaupii]
MIYSIGLINKSPMLPNLTLGYEIYDTCGDVTMAIKATLRLMEDRSNHTHECLSLRNEYTASARGAKVVVGERHSEISIAVARLLALPLIPQEILPTNVFHDSYEKRLTSLLQTVNESTAEGIVIFTKTSNVRAILEEAIRLGVSRTWIASDSWSTSGEIRSLKGIHTIGKVYGFIMKRNTVPGFEEHVRSFTAQPKMKDSFFSDYLKHYPACPSPTADITPNGQDPQNCSFHDGSATTNCRNIQCLTEHIDQDESYSIYLAVNVVARALHRLLKCDYMKCNRSATFSGREEDEYVSPERDRCLKKAVAFLKWTDGFAVVLAAFGVAGLIFTLLVAALFIKHRGTPIVKGTGGNLCFLILVSLATSFGSLCAFIGKPTDLSCKVGLPLFIISFSLCVSCILANLFQIRVGFAFNAKAHDRLMRFNNPVAIATGCVSIQVALVAAWLALAPPFRQEVSTYRAKVVVQCANGSDAMFGATLSYIAFLAAVCFLFAFKGKQLPDLYKNSSFITVGMLVYLVAWMLFIPVYVNTSGKYVQVVEASAMLVSNYSILCCHFCPKCYIILFRKELNNERVILDYIKKHYESKGVSPVTTDK